MNGADSLGYAREAELCEALVKRFGKNCVYRSPKIRVHGQEKELGDVVVLALPYMIVFQLKWKKITSEDLCGEKGALYKSRLVKTLQKAANQFKELASSLQQKATVELPQVWFPDNDAIYRFPLELVSHVVPIVIVDFDDKRYDNPDERFEGAQPVVTEVPSQIKSWGAVHSFILRDFYRILDQLFTVGDLLYWLKEREKVISGRKRAIIGYGELTLFSVYLVNYPLWEKFNNTDCIFLMDNDCFERITKDWEKEFAKRQEIFGQRYLFDAIDDTMVRALSMVDEANRNEVILSYLSCQGRMLCCSARDKRTISLKLKSHLDQFKGKENSFAGSFAISEDHPVLPRTAFYFGVASYTEENALEYCSRAYGRVLSVLRDHGLSRVKDEVLVLFVRSDTKQVLSMLRKVASEDYRFAPAETIIDQASYSLAKEKMSVSEWDVVRGA